jgi:hypothetical protein
MIRLFIFRILFSVGAALFFIQTTVAENKITSHPEQEQKSGEGEAEETIPVVSTEDYYTRGAIMAFCRGKLIDTKKQLIKDRGFCWSLLPQPTIDDNKVIALDYFGQLSGLTPNTRYYVRAYASNSKGETGYGEEIEIQTLPLGNLTYTVNRDGNTSNAAIYDRIEAAMETAAYYYEHFTTINNKRLNVTYNSGVATADANYAGNMRFGPNESYQRAGTALHETAHTVGVGQHSMWGHLLSGGKWLGERANKVLQFMTNAPTANIKGDTQHFWPYGINGAHEDDGKEMTYIINVLIVQGMFEDGLPGSNVPVASQVWEPETVKYYLKTEANDKGRRTSFLIEANNGLIANRTLTVEEALANDYAAWQVHYDPQTCFYSIRNAGSGNYLKYTGTYNSASGHQGQDIIRVNPLLEDEKQRYWFQLIRSCNTFIPGAGNNDSFFTSDAFGIVMNGTNNFQSLDAYSATYTGTWEYEAGKTNQQWSFLAENQLQRMIDTGNLLPLAEDQPVRVYASEGNIYILSEQTVETSIYSIDGYLLAKDTESQFPVKKGCYIVKTGGKTVKIIAK